MGQIVKRKKKGRPSKADLARRNAGTCPRRSVRPRNVKYTFDYDDDDDEDENRREKKLELLLKPQSKDTNNSASASASSSGHDVTNMNTPPLIKKRKIDEVEVERGEQKDVEFAPLPDKGILELILDKLQKKDIYGVYAEPVDPEELPDYHEVIKSPMDFATVRRKLGNGTYTNFEQFENDVFLICANAMQYNAPDTIYYKQACSIEELAKRRFQRLRIDVEGSEKDIKSEPKTRSNSLTKKQIKKPISQTVQEPVGSDFSCGATLATSGDLQNGPNVAHVGGCERPGGVDGLIEGNSSLIDSNLDKGEELLPAKGLIPRLGRKPSAHDDNRRATYNISSQPVATSESIFTTFEGESRQLVPVGLHADHSYARCLSRFAATLGSVVWKVASQRIEQALPAEYKFGRGWVGEYEPLPTPVLMLENCTPKGPVALKRSQCTIYNAGEVDKTSKTSVSASEVKSPSLGPVGTRLTTNLCTSNLSPAKDPVRGDGLDGIAHLSCSPRTKPTDFVSVNYQRQNSLSRNSIEPEKKISKQVELNCPPLANQNTVDFIAERQISNGSRLQDSRSMENVSRNWNHLHSGSFKQSNISEVIAGEMPNGKAMNCLNNNNNNNTMLNSSPGSFPNLMARAPTYFPQGQDYGLCDPVQLMRMLAEKKAQYQHNSSNPSPVDIQPVMPSSKREDLSNAALAAARAWMSVGAQGIKPIAENTSTYKTPISPNSVYNPTPDRQAQVSRIRGEFPVSGMHFQPDLMNSFPHNTSVPQPIRMSNEAQFQNQPMGFPQLVTADLSRFQVQQSHWRGLNPQMQPPRHKQEPLPPDLNIGFQPRVSPVRQADSQQPDLALQL